ncbi:transposase, IS4 family protein [Candidatus Vecturithrix granuli]|uniref:Transposase, IS4 family protein n=1 Tax=Vecturithrix granuli TaxID=1499967 RepID=A0A081C3S4_VECG1|nr:transposase, IS4 family protein [Candidatus Vecturithrix granuli]
MINDLVMTNFTRCTNMLITVLVDLDLRLSLPLRRLIATVMACLLEGTDAHLSDLAEALPDIESDQGTKEQRLRRLLSHPELSPQRFLPAYLRLLSPILQRLPELVLSMDRTHWKKRKRHVNILMVAVHFQGRAIPLYWTVLDRAGNSGIAEWKTVLRPVITAIRATPALAHHPLIVAADREFASPQLAEWLHQTFAVDSVLRVKRSEYLCDQTHDITLADLVAFLPQGETRYDHRVTVTKTSTWLVNVTITWAVDAQEPLLVLSTLTGAALSLATYQRRFGIEPMFKDQKTTGFTIEQTKVTDPKRIETLLILTTFAHILCTTEGDRQEQQGEIKKNGIAVPSFALAGSFLLASSPLSKPFVKRVPESLHNLSTAYHVLWYNH